MRHPFLRTLAGSAAPAATDPNFKNVTLLLHGDGTNGGQNNTFVDGSTNNFTITRNGNTTQGTFSPYGDNWSNFFDGTDDYLSIADNANLRAGSGAFTIEAWIYREATGVAHTIYAKGGVSTGIVLQVTATNVLRFTHTTTNIDSTGTIGLATWTHVAVVREGTGTNETKLYINGTQDGAGTVSTDFTQTEEVRIGTNRGATEDFNGYISNLRFVKGTAVYTGAFTVPTSPLTAISNTQLLTCKSNRFRDESANAFTVTRNNNASVQRFSPFSPTAAYAAGTIGGSGYFDGTGDNIFVSSASGLCNFASGEAFTFQVWFYRLASAEMVFIGAGSGTFQMGVSGSTGGVRYSKPNFADVFFNVGSVPIGTWTHITLCRNTSNTTRCWVNGVSVASTTTDTNSYSLAATYVGSQPAGTNTTNGFLSDMRILKGQALYDPTSSANIAVPTAPLTAVTNTSFLLNFTNSAIIDNAMMAVPETVGDVKINTSVKKYGTGSLSFDGNSDYLWIKNAGNLFDLSAGDFTVELWFYAMDKGDSESAESLIQQNEQTWRIWLRKLSGPRVLSYTVNGTNAFFTAGNLFNWDTWNHVAICKSGTTTTMYLNGVSVGTTTLVPAASSGPVYIGSNLVGTTVYWPMLGYIDDLRITKGVARYTANFTPPAAALPDL